MMIAERSQRVRVSDRALARIRALLDERTQAGSRVRLFAERAEGASELEVGLSFDVLRPGDEEMDFGGFRLVADFDTLSLVEGRVLDYEGSEQLRGFTLLGDEVAPAEVLPNIER